MIDSRVEFQDREIPHVDGSLTQGFVKLNQRRLIRRTDGTHEDALAVLQGQLPEILRVYVNLRHEHSFLDNLAGYGRERTPRADSSNAKGIDLLFCCDIVPLRVTAQPVQVQIR